MEITSAILTLFFVMDPIGNVPVFLSVLKAVPEERRRIVLIREMGIALGILLFFLLAGRYLLEALHLSPAAIQISGAIVLILIALNMAFPQNNALIQAGDNEEPFVVPLAVPLVAGPSTVAVLMLLANSEPARLSTWIVALLVAWLASLIILLCSSPLSRILGKRGLTAMERLVGMLLVMIAVQMFIDGGRAALALSGSA